MRLREGDGTRARPFSNLQDAVTGAAPGTTIALARGTFSVALILGDRITLAGACPEGTIIRGDSGRPSLVAGPGSSARNLTLEGIAQVPHGATLDAHGVVFDGQADDQALILRGNVTVDGAIFKSARIHGVAVIDTGRATIGNALFEHNGDTGLLAGSDGNAVLTNVTIRDNATHPGTGFAVVVVGATAAVTHADFSDLGAGATYVAGSTSTLSLTDVRIHDPTLHSTGPIAVIEVDYGAKLIATALSIERAGSAAIVVRGSTLSVDGLSLRGVSDFSSSSTTELRRPVAT